MGDSRMMLTRGNASYPRIVRFPPYMPQFNIFATEVSESVRGLVLPAQSLAFLLRRGVPLAHPSDAQDENISLAERDTFLLRARFEVRGGDCVGRPGVVWQRFGATFGEEVHEVKEHATPADTMLRPIYRNIYV